ncbi:MAG: glycerol kinase [Planctomycetia bacterium]|nr:glycerol kinase [Planctomycetia bacterium]
MAPGKTCVLALDQGTTSSRAILFDAAGMPLGVAQEEFPQHAREERGPDGEDLGVVEHDPEAIWRTQLACARRVLTQTGTAADQVAAVGITNQRETTILWDRTSGRPVAPAIVWQSRVSAPICRRLEAAGAGPEVRRRTGLLLDPYFSATKIVHLLETIPGLRDRCRRGEILFGTVDSFLVWRLTGGRVHATDVTNASRTLLYDIHELAWSDDLCRIFDVPREILPDVRPSSGDYGTVAADLLGAELPITGCAGDQEAAAFGQGVVAAGDAKTTYGTGAFLVFSTGDRIVASRHGLLATPLCAAGGPPAYCLEGSVFVAGALVGWLRDGLGLIERAADIERLAASVATSGGVAIVPALTGLGAPHWDPAARGLIIGLSRATTKGHIARAALEAIALSVADVVTCMKADSGTPLARLRVDGGATANDLLMQIQADVLGIPVERPAVRETTALGAALLAGLATGFYAGPAAVTAARRVERRFEPAGDESARRRLLETWRAAVERSKGWAVGR